MVKLLWYGHGGINAGKIIKTNLMNGLKKMYTWLVWLLVGLLHYVNIFYWLYRIFKSLWKPKPYRLKRYDYGATIQYQPSLIERCHLYFIGESGQKKRLLYWISDKLPTFCIDDFSNCWSNGIAICALIDAVVPETCPRYDLLNPEYMANNCRLGMRLVAKALGIAEPMTPEQMSNPRKIQENIMIGYLQMIQYASVIPVKEPERIMLKLEETIQVNDKECRATGSGLVVAIEGKRTKFNVHADAFIWKNIYVEISGPNGEYCKRKINHAQVDRTQTSSRKISGEKDEPDKDNRFIFFDYEEIKEGEYQVIYTPCNVGTYGINITWGGEHIKNSPFSATVKEPILNSASKSETGPKRVSFNTDNPKQKMTSAPTGNPSVKSGRRQSLFRQSNLESDNLEDQPRSQSASSTDHRNSVKSPISRSGSIFGKSVKNTNGRRGKIIRKIIKCPSGDKEIRYASKSLSAQKSVVSSKDSIHSAGGPKRSSKQTAGSEDKYGKFADRLSKQLIGRVYYEITKEIIQVKSRNMCDVVDKTDASVGKISTLQIPDSESIFKNDEISTTRDEITPPSLNTQQLNVCSISNQELPSGSTVTSLIQINQTMATEDVDQCSTNETKKTYISNETKLLTNDHIEMIPKENGHQIIVISKSTNSECSYARSSQYDKSLESSISIDDYALERSIPTFKHYRPTWQLPTIDRPSEDFPDREHSGPSKHAKAVVQTASLSETDDFGTSPPLVSDRPSEDFPDPEHSKPCKHAKAVVQTASLSETDDIGTSAPLVNAAAQGNKTVEKSSNSIESTTNINGIPNENNISQPNISENKVIASTDQTESGRTNMVQLPSKEPSDAKRDECKSENNKTHQKLTLNASSSSTRATQSNTRLVRRSSRNKSTHDKGTQCTSDSIRKATGWGYMSRHRQSFDEGKQPNSETHPKDGQALKNTYSPSNDNDLPGHRKPEVERLKRPKRRLGLRQTTFDSGFSDEHALSGNNKSPDSSVLVETTVGIPPIGSQCTSNSMDVLATEVKIKTENSASFVESESRTTSVEDIHSSENGTLPSSQMINGTANTTMNGENHRPTNSLTEAVSVDLVTESTIQTPSDTTFNSIINTPISVFNKIEADQDLTDCLSPVSIFSPLVCSSNEADISNMDADESSLDTDESVLDLDMSLDLPGVPQTDKNHSFQLPVYPFQEWIHNVGLEFEDVQNHRPDMQEEFERHHSPNYSLPRSDNSSYNDRYRAVHACDTMSCRSANSFRESCCHCPNLRRRCDESSSFSSSDFSCPKRQYPGCRAFGVGLTEGYVNMKNNFQVETSQASKGGYLSVTIRGPQRHSVTETNVVFTGDNLYEILYEVNTPGFYVISVKWSEQHVSNSPFIVAIEH
ncbi:uncharacterized protein [Antedon mediterranea]|uniref:uncharacterized protein n=1 Tax=Antedon mediterranea TaxID=105859 RepID=UPI003AF983C7